MKTLAAVLLLSACAFAQISITPVGIVQGESSVSTCQAALKQITEEINALDHPQRWTFYVACSLHTWKAIEQRENVTNDGAFTSPEQRLTFVNGNIFIDPLSIFGRGYTPEQVVAHEMAHIMLNKPKKDRKTEAACDAWADAELRKITLRKLPVANQPAK